MIKVNDLKLKDLKETQEMIMNSIALLNLRIGQYEELHPKKVYDFSKYVGRSDCSLAIIGQNIMIKSFNFRDGIVINNDCRSVYINPVSWEECTVRDLQKDDLFINIDFIKKDNIIYFNIVQNIYNNGINCVYLDKDDDVQSVYYYKNGVDVKVLRALIQ